MNKDRLVQVSKRDFDKVVAKFSGGLGVRVAESHRVYTNSAKNRVVGERHKFEDVVEYYLTDEMADFPLEDVTRK